MLRDAASGNQEARADFVRRYLPAVRAYLASRWRGTTLFEDLEDAVQEVFMHFLEPGSLLDDGLDRLESNSFRGYLYGLVRNVALMTERKNLRRREGQPPSSVDLAAIEASEVHFSAAFDRAWAQGVLADAVALVAKRAESGGPDAQRRFRILRQRFGDAVSAEEIASREGLSRATAFREILAAGVEFRDAVKEVISRQAGCDGADVESQCVRILELLE